MSASAIECPQCLKVAVVRLANISKSVDYYRCRDCGYLWNVEKGTALRQIDPNLPAVRRN